MVRFSSYFLLASLTLATLACGNNDVVPALGTEVVDRSGGTTLDPVDGPVWQLSLSSDAPVTGVAGDTLQIPFQVTRDGEAMEAEVVRFELTSLGGEATLSKNYDTTRVNGMAAAELQLGSVVGSVAIAAYHQLGGEAIATIKITEAPAPLPLPATLRVGVLYGSSARWPIDTVEVKVGSGTDCAGMDQGNTLAPPSQQKLTDLRNTLLYTRVDTGTPLAVEAVGFASGVEMASGCVEGLSLAEGENGGVVVRLLPLGLDVTGTWGLHHELDFGNALPGDLGSVFTVLDQLFNDPDDPARFLVTWIEGELGLNLGPLENTVIGLLDQQIKATLPAGIQGLFTRIGEAARLVTHFGVDATAVISQQTGNLQADEHWDAATFSWKGQPVSVDLAASGLTPVDANYPVQVADDARLIIPAHSFEIPFVGLYRVVLTNLVYPDLGGGATTTHDLLASVIDCAAVASRIDASDGTTDGQLDLGLVQVPNAQLEGSCDAGLGYVAGQIDAQLDGMAGSGPSTLTLDGVADLVGDDGQRHPTTLDAGQWTGSLEFSANTHTLSGSFSGTRR